MSAHVLLNLLNKVEKSDKMRGLLSILSLFCSKFNKFNNTGAGMLDSIYHMTLKLLLNHIFVCKIFPYIHLIITDVITPHGIILLADMMSYDNLFLCNGCFMLWILICFLSYFLTLYSYKSPQSRASP